MDYIRINFPPDPKHATTHRIGYILDGLRHGPSIIFEGDRIISSGIHLNGTFKVGSNIINNKTYTGRFIYNYDKHNLNGLGTMYNP